MDRDGPWGGVTCLSFPFLCFSRRRGDQEPTLSRTSEGAGVCVQETAKPAPFLASPLHRVTLGKVLNLSLGFFICNKGIIMVLFS